MRIAGILLGMVFLFPIIGFAANNNPRFRIAASYDTVFVAPGELNDYRDSLQFYSITASGKVERMAGYSLSVGKTIWTGILSLNYSASSLTLPDSVYTTYTNLLNKLTYSAVYLIYDYPIFKSGFFSGSLGAGIGKTLDFTYHEQLSGGASDATEWSGQAYPTKLRIILEDALTENINMFLNGEYEMVTSELKAKTDYAHGIGGSAVSKDQNLKNYFTNKNVNADLTGWRLCLGLAVLF